MVVQGLGLGGWFDFVWLLLFGILGVWVFTYSRFLFYNWFGVFFRALIDQNEKSAACGECSVAG